MWFLVILAISAIASAVAWEDRMTRHLLGRIIWPGNDLLPTHAAYRVSLVDLTTKGAPVVVASTNRRLKDGGEGMPFDLTWHRRSAKPDRHYGLWAEIVAGDKVIYNSVMAQIADLDANQALMLYVQPVITTSIVAPPSLYNILPDNLGGTIWRVQAMAGGPASADKDAVLEIRPNGQLVGRVSGYAFFAEAAFEDTALRVAGLTAGGFATQLDLQERQNRMFQSLFATTRFDLQDESLRFFDAQGQAMLTMEPFDTADGETLH